MKKEYSMKDWKDGFFIGFISGIAVGLVLAFGLFTLVILYVKS